MFPDASDEHCGSFLTQVSQSKVDRGVYVEDMRVLSRWGLSVELSEDRS